ncbi:unnamed protein product (mitochondrion) [Plasmodiophora brassicae]|uniref:Uncharacterized protein n=1 Tax=Plasmodiophora brassicae TaxID=37360 RepID=A0A3P3Y1Z2_PLABS|nr:unnamed protein product [Plasmodiophora brassicae]
MTRVWDVYRSAMLTQRKLRYRPHAAPSLAGREMPLDVLLGSSDTAITNYIDKHREEDERMRSIKEARRLAEMERKTKLKRTPGVLLHTQILCNTGTRRHLLPETKDDCNMIVLRTRNRNDYGIVVEVLDKLILHAALQLTGSPFGPERDEDMSYKAFLRWLDASACLANEIAFRKWRIPQWASSIDAARYRGPVAKVLWLRGTNRNEAHMFNAPIDVFGRIKVHVP